MPLPTLPSWLLAVWSLTTVVFAADFRPPDSGQRRPADVLIARGAAGAWKYFEGGADPGTAWRMADFVDPNWKQGSAPLGYGEPDVVTTLGFGGRASDKHRAAYFRREFHVPDAARRERLAVVMRVDDGAVVYLNGREIVRHNMPVGTVTSQTLSARAIGGAEESLHHRYAVPATALQAGRNLLAVEVHQCDPESTDLFFDLELTSWDEHPVARITPVAREVSLMYLNEHYVPSHIRIPDGYVDGGRGMKINADGTVQTSREAIVVDRTRDALLKKHADYARSPMLSGLPPLERATLLALYVDRECSPPDGRSLAWQSVEELQQEYRGREFLLGQSVSSGVCRHRALLFKVLADEAGLAASLVRGNLAGAAPDGAHAWNELFIEGGKKLIVDVSNPSPGFRFPATMERAADSYITLRHAPYYAKERKPGPEPAEAAARTTPTASPVPSDPDGQAIVQAAQKTIAAFHVEHDSVQPLLRVVYFHPRDRDPLPDYAERLDRVLNDVSAFYEDGLRRFGIKSNGLPFERKNGRIVLHLVRGKLPASGYRHESGNETAAEIRAALQGTVDMDHEHVLVLYALCRTEPDGRHVFDAPYYGDGGSNQRAGLCHAADCSLLDPLLLSETKKKIVYTEHYYPRVEQTLAKFNSWYIGGIAHELGHGLGLPHDSGNASEQNFGTSLMGGGNHTYRQERWGGGSPTFLSRASALQLASHPLITGSNRSRGDAVASPIEKLTFSSTSQTLEVRGKIGGRVPPYAAIAYVWPASSKTDHGARSFATMINGDAFTLPIAGFRPGAYHFRLSTLHVNGATSSRRFSLSVDREGRPDASALQQQWRRLTEAVHQRP